MNKDSIYQIIGYHGEYNDQIKRAIRKLLKENHPDNNGNQKIFEIINEVKNELENNKVPNKYKKNKLTIIQPIDDIDYQFCYKKKSEIELKREALLLDLELNKKNLIDLENEYKVLYKESINLETKILTKSSDYSKIKSIKIKSIILLFCMIIVFILAMLNNNIILFIIFVFLVIICILIIQNYFEVIRNLTENNKINLKKYIHVINSLRNNIKKKDSLKEIMNDKKRILNNYENDLRFYKNLLK